NSEILVRGTYDVVNLILQGASNFGTILDFSDQASGNAFTIAGHVLFHFRDLSIHRPYRHGIAITGIHDGEPRNSAYFELRNLKVSGSRTGSGIFIGNAFMGSIENVWSIDNARAGFEVNGFATSLLFARTHAESNRGPGYFIHRLVYS